MSTSEYRDPRFQELDRLIAEGLENVSGILQPYLTRRRCYTLRRRAHPRRLRHRPDYEPPEVRRAIYLRERGRL